MTLVVLAVANQWADLTSAVTSGIQQLEDLLSGVGITVDGSGIQQAIDAAGSSPTSASFGSTALSGPSTLGGLATGVVLVVVVVFFLLRDGRAIWTFLIRPLRGDQRDRAQRIGTASTRVLGSSARGMALVALVDAIFIGAGLLICGVPLALPLSVLVFVTAFIPIVGATLAGTILGGIVGAILSSPTASVVRSAIKAWNPPTNEADLTAEAVEASGHGN